MQIEQLGVIFSSPRLDDTLESSGRQRPGKGVLVRFL
jgi:hypothetical protein